MAQYRKKPVIVDAERFVWYPESWTSEIRDAMFMEFPVHLDGGGHYVLIPTQEGTMRADIGDWIITGIAGEKYPCKPEIFEKTYEKV